MKTQNSQKVVQIQKQYHSRRRKYIEEVLVKFDHTSDLDTAVMDYIRLLKSDFDTETHFRQKVRKGLARSANLKMCIIYGSVLLQREFFI